MSRARRPPLDGPERAVSAALPPLHGRDHPGEGVDTRILAAAHAALSAPGPRTRARRNWGAPLGVAATLVIAAGLAWQRLPPAPAPAPTIEDVATTAPESASVDAGTPVTARAAPAQDVPSTTPPRREPASAAPIVAARPPADIARDAAAPLPPPPPAVAKPAPSTQAPLPAQAAISPATPAAAAAEASLPRESAATVAPVAAAIPAPPPKAQPTASAATAAPQEAPIADDDVPPATVDAPGVRDAWLRRIGELVAEGRMDEARESLSVFRRRYPDAVLPPELQALEAPPADE